EEVVYLEAYVVEREAELGPGGGLLVEERDGLDGGRLELLEEVRDELHREAGVHDVLDDDDVAAFDLGVDLLELGDGPAGNLLRAVGRELEDVHLAVDRHAPHEVGEEHVGAVEDADEDGPPAGVLLADGAADGFDTARDG